MTVAPDFLAKFMNDARTLNTRIVHDRSLYVKVEDCGFHGQKYVLLRVKHPSEIESLQLYRKDRKGRWRRIATYFLEPQVFNFEWEEVMEVAIKIITRYTARMAMFE